MEIFWYALQNPVDSGRYLLVLVHVFLTHLPPFLIWIHLLALCFASKILKFPFLCLLLAVEVATRLQRLYIYFLFEDFSEQEVPFMSELNPVPSFTKFGSGAVVYELAL